MLIADLKSKLSAHESTSEDFLTSAVFSAFRWLPTEWLYHWLATATNLHGDRLELPRSSPDFDFWPWFRRTQYGRGAEPDVVIRLGTLAIIVEAKFHSGKSSEGLVGDESDKSEDARQIALDQLARQYFIGREHCVGDYYHTRGMPARIERSIVLYVTKHHGFPTDDIRETVQCVEDAVRHGNGETTAKEFRRDAENGIYWMNWQRAHRVFEEARDKGSLSEREYDIASEIVEFLDRRDLSLFRGFDSLNELRFTACPSPVFYRAEDRQYWAEIDTIAIEATPKTVFYQSTSTPYWLFLDSGKPINHSGNEIFYQRTRK